MTWIKTILPSEATGKLVKLYHRLAGPQQRIDNILLAHSLRPHTLEGHMALYKNVLHHQANALAKSLLEAIGTYVSLLNQCDYCVDHHFAGYRRLIKDDSFAEQVLAAFKSGKFESVFSAPESLLLAYARELTLNPATIQKAFIQELREAGYSDGEILEVNQVVAYFNYANRTVLGLGVSTEGDVLGLSPSDASDEQNWQHQ